MPPRKYTTDGKMVPNDGVLPQLSLIFESIPEAYDRIFDALPPAGLCQVRKLSRDARIAVQDYEVRVFSPNRLLEQFFPDPFEFRSLQCRTGTLVSGSQALQLLSRCRWPNSDLDLYVWQESALEVCAWLEGQGYEYKPLYFQSEDLEETLESSIISGLQRMALNQDQIDEEEAAEIAEDVTFYDHNSIANVIAFEKETGLETLKTQVIIGRNSPMEMILSFHSSKTCLFP